MSNDQHQEASNNNQDSPSNLIFDDFEGKQIFKHVKKHSKKWQSSKNAEPGNPSIQFVKNQARVLSVNKDYQFEENQPSISAKPPTSTDEVHPSGRSEPEVRCQAEPFGENSDSTGSALIGDEPNKVSLTCKKTKKRRRPRPFPEGGEISESPPRKAPKGLEGEVLGKRRPGSPPSRGFCKIKRLQVVSGGRTKAMYTRHARVDFQNPQVWGSGGGVRSCRPTRRVTKERPGIQPNLTRRPRSGSHYSSESDFDQWRDWILHPSERKRQPLHQEVYPLLFSHKMRQFVVLQDHDIQLVNDGVAARGAVAAELLCQQFFLDDPPIPLQVIGVESGIPLSRVPNMADELFLHGPHIELGVIQYESLLQATSNVYSS